MRLTFILSIAGSLFSFTVSLIGFKHLAPYTLHSVDGFEIFLSNALKFLLEKSPDKTLIISTSIIVSISAVISGIIVYHLVSLYSEDLIKAQKFALIVWISVLSINILISVYYLIFVVLLLIVILVILLAVLSNPGKNGGSVYVRSHYRRRPQRRY